MPLSSYRSLRNSRWYEWVFMVILTILPLVGGFLGARFFNTGIYKSGKLAVPSWAPPSWLFSPVWSVLYLMMGVAWALMWRQGGGFNADTAAPFAIFTLHLILNWTWTPLFFGFGQLCCAFWVACAMWGLVVSCVMVFPRCSKVASLLLIPYLIWLTYASYLNQAIVDLNGCYVQGMNKTLF